MRTAEITDFIKLTIVMVLGVVIGLGIQYVTAQYSAPPASPPSGNIANPPLTTGASQTKSGGLTVGGVLQTNTQLNLCSGATCGFLRTNAHSHLRGSTVYLDSGSWGVILRDGAGSMNVQPRSDVSSMYVNDIYLRSAGRWMSDVAAGGTRITNCRVCIRVLNGCGGAGHGNTIEQACTSLVGAGESSTSGWAQMHDGVRSDHMDCYGVSLQCN
jgi:hypothetical protein